MIVLRRRRSLTGGRWRISFGLCWRTGLIARIRASASSDRRQLPIPFASNLSPAGQALGLGSLGVPGYGGGQLADQVAGLTDEECRRRMALLQQQRQLGPGGSAAASAVRFGVCRFLIEESNT